MKAVFDAKAGSPYKDDVATRYHFPKRLYMDEMARIRGDWVVYREPRENGGSIATRRRNCVPCPLRRGSGRRCEAGRCDRWRTLTSRRSSSRASARHWRPGT